MPSVALGAGLAVVPTALPPGAPTVVPLLMTTGTTTIAGPVPVPLVCAAGFAGAGDAAVAAVVLSAAPGVPGSGAGEWEGSATGEGTGEGTVAGVGEGSAGAGWGEG